jgi:2-dehydro-3-deoxyphosphogluconate aldolase/(4S)-4-hydroxy-2-oxoglutarate aldolase
VLTIDAVRTALPLAEALVAGGLPVLEITLRTPAALEIIRAISGEVEGAVVGAGTVLTPAQFRDAAVAGARFAVSPGATPALLDVAEASSVPFLPGALTSSEVMRLLERGYGCLKFFPAEPAGGVAHLQALAAPLPEARFCPTGGIDAKLAPAYLALPNVVCIGGSWVAPRDAVAAGDWPASHARPQHSVLRRGRSARSPIDDRDQSLRWRPTPPCRRQGRHAC